MTEEQGTVAQRPHDPVLDLHDVGLDGPLKDMAQAWAIARVLAQSTMVPRALQGSPQNCFVTMMTGQELGLRWQQAIRAIYVTPNGQPGLRGSFLLARIRQVGHRYTFERGDDYCKCIITRKDEDYAEEYVGEFSLTDALAADLITEKDGRYYARSLQGNKPLPWEQYRRDMLQWRAVARACGIGAPEVIYGFDIAGISENEEPAPTAPLPAPAQPKVDDVHIVRDKLAELDSQAQQGQARRDDTRGGGLAVAEYDATPEGSASDMGAADEGENTSTDPRAAGATAVRGAQPSAAPDLDDLRKLLNRCGYTEADDAADAVSALVHRPVFGISSLTGAEILMAHDMITKAVKGATRSEQRHDRLAKVITAERDAWGGE